MTAGLSILHTTVLAVAAFLASALGTGMVWHYAINHAILDIPGERSSHSVPTPRGGGLAFAAIFLLILWALCMNGSLVLEYGAALGGGGLAVMLIGWLDDRYDMPVWIRLLVHISSAIWALYWIWGGSGVAGSSPLWNTIQYLASLGGIIWMINLFNFMDGIDGLAATEAIMTSLAAGFLLFIFGAPSLGAASIILACCVGGFLLWNWPPAKIFMGDAGSGFLGYELAVLALLSNKLTVVNLEVWLILLVVFITDASVTLAIRVLKRETWWLAHREHIYQKLVIKGHSHRDVTGRVSIINILLVVLALIAVQNPDTALFLVLAIYIAFIWAYFILFKRLV